MPQILVGVLMFFCFKERVLYFAIYYPPKLTPREYWGLVVFPYQYSLLVNSCTIIIKNTACNDYETGSAMKNGVIQGLTSINKS